MFLLSVCAMLMFPVGAVFAKGHLIADQISIIKSDAEHQEKWQAKEQLVRSGKEAVKPLIDVLADEDARYYAIRALGDIKDERAVGPLAEILLNKNYGPRRYAAVALGSIKSLKAVPALRRALEDEREFVSEDALTALQHIQPSEGKAYLEKWLSRQEPNGLEIKLFASKLFNTLKLKIEFKNNSQTDFHIHWPETYQAAGLILQDASGRFIQPLRTVMYDHMTSETDFKLIKANGTFCVNLTGKIKTLPPAKDSRSSLIKDWWKILYPRGPFRTVNFKDTEIDIGLLDSKPVKIYFLFAQGETAQYWGHKFGYENIWTGRVVAQPATIELE